MYKDEDNNTYTVSATSSTRDWAQVKECYIECFTRYPLYKYMVADESKRVRFLRAYFDANYEVTVGSGKGVLVKMTAMLSGQGEVAGGVLCVPPSSDGRGWAIGEDGPYWEAYDKHKLAEISTEGLKRLKRYEAWENKQIAEKFAKARIPAWNGLFCAISPKFSAKGIGTALYKETVKLITAQTMQKFTVCTNLWGRQQIRLEKVLDKKGDSSTEKPRTNSQNLLPQDTAVDYKKYKARKNTTIASGNSILSNSNFSIKQPLVVAISHSERAAHYYETNGFYPTTETPYVHAVSEVAPFNVHVLVLDPFKTGRTLLCRDMFRSTHQPF